MVINYLFVYQYLKIYQFHLLIIILKNLFINNTNPIFHPHNYYLSSIQNQFL